MTTTHRPAWISRLTEHIPPGQFLRYLLIGGFNTAFGYGCYAGLTWLLQSKLEYGYVIAGLAASIINTTVSFLGYKWLVFRTRGNYLREWLRSIAVYSVAIIINTALLPVLVFVLRRTTALTKGAPYVAGAFLLGFTVLFSFIGHKKFSFQSSSSDLVHPSEVQK